MTDQELLERAARAADVKLAVISPFVHRHGEGAMLMDGSIWNPLDDDGDAFRLMVALGMEVKCYSNVTIATTPDDADTEEVVGEETCKPDEVAATRRAIVRAAAAMGVEDG